MQHGSTVVAERRGQVGEHFPLVFLSLRVRVRALVRAGTCERDVLMAALVDHETAHLTLKALLAEAPDEIFAVAAEGWLFKEAWNELVVFHIIHIFLLQGTFSAANAQAKLCIHVPRAGGIILNVLVVRHPSDAQLTALQAESSTAALPCTTGPDSQ